MSPAIDPALESTLTSKGQATIPKQVRDFLNLKPGARIRFFLHPNGYVAILPTTPASALKGIVRPRRDTPISLQEMAEAGPAGVTTQLEAPLHR